MALALPTYVLTRDETVVFSTDDKEVIIAYLLAAASEELALMLVNGENSSDWLFDHHIMFKRNGTVTP